MKERWVILPKHLKNENIFHFRRFQFYCVNDLDVAGAKCKIFQLSLENMLNQHFLSHQITPTFVLWSNFICESFFPILGCFYVFLR